MAVCLERQAVYRRSRVAWNSLPVQLFAAVILLVALAVKVSVKIRSVDLGYQLARERERTVQLDMERRELELQRSLLLRPDSLSKVASEKLGLHPLDPRQARRISVQ